MKDRDTSPANPGVPWPAVDGLGRALPLSGDVGPARTDRFVGIFYFLWLGQHDRGSDGPYDVSRILAANPDAASTPTSPPWGPPGAFHYWGEPLYGYYRGDDPWVLRRHAHLLADAGIDTLIFDTTNRRTYPNVHLALCEVFSQVRREGGRTPHIAFMCNSRAGETAQELYDTLYSPGHHEELWFIWKGKPLLICDPADASPEVRAFFTLRKAHWPFELVNTANAWHWESTYPQVYGFTDDPETPEQVNVAVAQNLRRSDGKVTNMSDGEARGRSFHNGATDPAPGAILHGHNAQEQWERALQLDPPFVMVTGWNEWIASRHQRGDNTLVFVDQYDQEYSRDIEIMRGGHHDHYYYQLVANVRRYKGMPPLPDASPPRTILIDGDFAQWVDVRPAYGDPEGETLPRDHPGVCGLHYKDQSGRNEFRLLKVACDGNDVFFYARTERPIDVADPERAMLLCIDPGPGAGPSWEGFPFRVGRYEPEAGRAALERSRGGWDWEQILQLRSRVEGCELHVAVPRRALGLTEGQPVDIEFKWIDHPQRPGEVMDLYLSGDTAPAGRFRFRYAPMKSPGAP